MRFVDLFAGLGGFHVGLKEHGFRCVFAAEKDPYLRELYEKNHGVPCAGDLLGIAPEELPEHELLCAGFPCQTFSRSGKRAGLQDSESRALKSHLLKIIRAAKPPFVLIENVPAFRTQGGDQLAQELEKMGYQVQLEELSPLNFGVPQARTRFYLIASLMHILPLPLPREHNHPPLRHFLGRSVSRRFVALGQAKIEVLEAWQRCLGRLPSSAVVPTPLWLPEYKATYPLDFSILSLPELQRFRGAYGSRLTLEHGTYTGYPRYFAPGNGSLPSWKRRMISRSRAFLREHWKAFQPEIKYFKSVPFSWQKLEPNGTKSAVKIEEHLVQFRPSGIRLRASSTAPSLVALSLTQVPILGWHFRPLSLREAAMLQGLETLCLPARNGPAFKAIGNAVCAPVVSGIAMRLQEAVSHLKGLPA